MSTQFHEFSYNGHNFTGTDAFGCLWTVEGITGWYTGGDVRATADPKAQQSGTRRGTPFKAGREIVARGKVFCPDAAAAELAARRLSALAFHEGVREFVGASPAGNLSMLASPIDLPLFDLSSNNIGSWQIAIGSEDPYLFGTPTFGSTDLAGSTPGAGLVYPLAYPLDYGLPPGAVPGSVPVANVGTAAYWPRLRLDGPAPNPSVSLVETGDTIQYNGTLLAGQWLDIDCQNRRVLLNGQVSVRHLVSDTGSWLAIPPGGGSVTWTADAADPAATLSVWSYEGAWL